MLSIGRANCLQRSIHRRASIELFTCAAPQFWLLDQGDLAAALRACRDSLAIGERLAERDQSNTQWQRHLALSYDHAALVLAGQGNLAGALDEFRKGQAIIARLKKQSPNGDDCIALQS